MKRMLSYMIMVCLALCTASCTYKELCMNHWEHAPKAHTRINAAWEQEWQYDFGDYTSWKDYPTWTEDFGMEYENLRPGIPKGLRLFVYNEDGSTEISNIEPEGGTVYMRPEEHSILLYNNDTEYIVFDNMHSYVEARATTRTRTRSTYFGNSYIKSDTDEHTVNPPDMLYGHYIPSYTVRRTEEPESMDVMMHPLVYSYVVRYEFDSGFEYVAAARGALAGMARAVYLNNGHTSPEAVTVLFDCELKESCIQANVRSFGIPDFPNEHYLTRGDDSYGLNLELRLKNGKMLNFDFDITDQMSRQPQGGVIVVSGVTVDEEDGKEGSNGGFSVGVDDWGEYEDIDLNI